MAKKNSKKNSSSKNQSQARVPTGKEPTPEQIARLIAVESEVKELSAKYGPPAAKGAVEQVGMTLEESLKRVETLLNNASAHFENAQKLEEANKIKEKRLNDVKTELAVKRREVAQAEDELTKRGKSLDKQVIVLNARDTALQAREAEQSAHFAEREFNAEQGFLAEKARILSPVEEEVKRLREERDRLEVEIKAMREKAEEDLRDTARTRAEQWAIEDADRLKNEAEMRLEFDQEMTQVRREKLAVLRSELSSEREKAEAAWQAELDRRSATFDARETELREREQAIQDRYNKQRAAELDLQAEQEMLAEERAALDRKVERVAAERNEEMRHEIAALEDKLTGARSKRDVYFKELESWRELDRRFGDRSPDEILSALNDAERERAELAEQLRERPDVSAVERLSNLERERSEWLEKQAVLQSDLAKVRAELDTRRLSAIELETLQKQKEALETHKQLLDGAIDELRTKVDELTRQEDHRNPMTALTSMDQHEDLQKEARTTSPLRKANLKEFADDLRHRIASGVEGRTLYYAERDVRAFLGGLAMTRLMLLQGISGTGKTSLPLAFSSAVGGGIEIVEVQAGWRDRQDLVGYYNAFHRHYYATNFLQALYKAGTPAYSDRLFIIVLDEINLSRPEQFFADFLSALEQPEDDRRLTLVNDPVTQAPRLMVDGRHLPIPPNVWFVGTANHDESTAEFADKTYDRAHIMEMPRNTDAARFSVEKRGVRNAISYKGLEEAFADAANSQKGAVDKATKWLRTAAFTVDLQKRFRVGWGNRLENQLTRYLPVVVESGGSVGEAMDHLLVTKVFRKLKDRHDVRADDLEKLSIALQEAWEDLDSENPPERSVALIEREKAIKTHDELL
ncbi:hypothetical protein DV096_18445 [Bradymonadaceae bacterium TMQ3]|nr:hypothetical protein DV096_18445 [Bradymonadaceae bacterium TMQ3]TXC74489.1 hypothetical protein FRC91_15345 [Bradymonadales bacterium TMQ1]